MIQGYYLRGEECTYYGIKCYQLGIQLHEEHASIYMYILNVISGRSRGWQGGHEKYVSIYTECNTVSVDNK